MQHFKGVFYVKTCYTLVTCGRNLLFYNNFMGVNLGVSF